MSRQTLKFSVIIPTRERAEVLKSALRTVCEQDYDGLSIIVSDNFSQDDTAEVVHSFDDPRIRHVNTGRRLSMSHNYAFALSHVEDGWVTILGDDDALMPGAIARVAELAAETGVEAVRSSFCKYRWPMGGSGGRLNVPLSKGTEMRDSAQWLQKVIDGKAGYTDLPMLYTGGFADKKLMDIIRDRMGGYYSSCVPDVFSGVAIASITQRYLFSNEPLAIAGVSRHSTGTHHFSRMQTADEVTPIQKFLSEENIPFHPDIPVCSDGITPRSPQVIFLESYLQSAPLRDALPPNFHAHQLEVIAAESDGTDADLTQWMKDFAALHGLDYGAAFKASRLPRLRERIFGMPGRMLRKWKTAKLRYPRDDIGDVYSASLEAARLLTGR
ncbi:MAG: glycosyltransferase [Alphaproteobacteria bacterium]|nr:glycosyltransferase [Alphaproteobacteria bacterium]MDX5493176.1 glycosyltransferase [Alphaproteobacteria bacterium]